MKYVKWVIYPNGLGRRGDWSNIYRRAPRNKEGNMQSLSTWKQLTGHVWKKWLHIIAKYIQRNLSEARGLFIRRKVKILEYRRGLAFARPDYRVDTEWKWPISGVHSIMMEKPAHAGEGEGVHALPLSLYLPSRTKLQCALQLRGQTHSPHSSLPCK
jgi:hypothetical protein